MIFFKADVIYCLQTSLELHHLCPLCKVFFCFYRNQLTWLSSLVKIVIVGNVDGN